MAETMSEDQDGEPFSTLLERHRLARRLTKKELARRAGLSLSYVSLLTGGGRQAPSAVAVEALARALALDPAATRDFYRAAGLAPTSAPEEPRRSSPHVDWAEAPDVGRFVGREDELAHLRQWVLEERCRVVGVFGIGGVGKTSFVTKLADQIKGEFTFVIWRSLLNPPPLSYLLRDLIEIIGGHQDEQIPEGTAERLALFVTMLREHRCLLVLDNAESILERADRPENELQESYGQLFRVLGEGWHQSCLLLTSREKPRELGRMEGSRSPVRSLWLDGVMVDEAREILGDKGLSGSDNDWRRFVQRYSGNPLALKIVAETVRELFNGDLHEFLAENSLFLGDLRAILDQQFARLSELEQDLIYWLAVNHEPATVEQLQSRLLQPVERTELLEALGALRRRAFINRPDDRLRGLAMPAVIVEYLLDRLIHEVVAEIKSGELRRLLSHALMLADAKEYVRHNQVQHLLEPIAAKLTALWRGPGALRARITELLAQLRARRTHGSGYAAGNLLNLLCCLNDGAVSGYDFSHLEIRQAYLREATVRDVSFAHADLSTTVFSDTFGGFIAIAYSPDGSTLAAASADGEIRLWPVGDVGQQLVLKGHTDWVRSVGFSPDGPLLVSGSEDWTVRLWRVSDGHCLGILSDHTNAVWSVAFSPDGQTIASASHDQTIRLWDLGSMSLCSTLRGHTNRVWSAVFSPDGSLLASCGDDRSLRIWRVSDRTRPQQLAAVPHQHQLWSIAFSPDGSLLASGGGEQDVRLWQVDSLLVQSEAQGSPLLVVPDSRRARSVAFSPDGRLIACGGENEPAVVKLWDIAENEPVGTLAGHEGSVLSIAFSPTDQILASAGEDHSVRLWDYRDGQCLMTLHGYTNPVWSVAFSPDGSLLACGNEDKTVQLWSLATRRLVARLGERGDRSRRHGSRVRSVAFSPDGRYLASGSEDKTIRLWDVATGEPLYTFEGHTNRVRSVTFSPDGSLLASGGEDYALYLWDMRRRRLLARLELEPEASGQMKPLRSVQFSPDGALVASGGDDDTIRVWDVASRRCIATLTASVGRSEAQLAAAPGLQGQDPQILFNRVLSIAFSPDGALLASGGDDQFVRLWEVGTGQCKLALEGHSDCVWSVAFSPDSQLLASGGDDQLVRVWEVATGRCLLTLEGHLNRIWSVAFSPDGARIASSSDDGTTRYWDAQTGECLATLRSDRPYERVDITGATGLSRSQRAALRALGAIEA